MASSRLSTKFLAGLAAISAAALAVAIEPAAAQVPIETVIQPPQPRRPKAPPARRPVPEEVGLDDPEAVPAPPQQQEQQPDEGEEPQSEDEPKVERSMAPSGGNAGRDLMQEPKAPTDGLIEDGTPGTVVVDGMADLNRDTRRPDEIGQPTGYDALAFQIEALDPLNDRRTDRLFRFEPYDPVGIRIGSFVIYPEAELGVLTNSNVFRSSRPAADFAYDTRGTVRVVSDWRVHALELRAIGRASFYDRFETENDGTWGVDARGRLDISRRSNIEIALSHLSDKDIRSLIDSPVNATRRGDVTTDRAAASFNQQLGRATLQLRGSLTDVNFSSVPSTNGTVINNDSRNYTQQDGAVRIAYALNRHAAVFVDTALREREYAVAAGDGFLRSSTSERYRLGVQFSPLGSILRGEISAGWGQQTPRDSRLATIQGYLLDASLAWRATALTSFLLSLRSEFYDTTFPNSPGTLAREVGLEVRHAFQRQLIGTAAVRHAWAPYEGVSLEDKLLTGELGLDLYVNGNVSLYARLQHLDFQSTDRTRNYIDDIVRVGVRVRQ